ncbi:hypothetical protein POTOM_029706 [Populus tomentosa]|uniref:Uncharacterized protein n=1 Tax=Populus tomentosa TaxID=118781 RepID=A0A8X7ZAJ6_POPTO|nr:hypothetical protein POTOM_029706 [Populus tomentosa]
MEGGVGGNGNEREEEQDGMSIHSPCKAPPSSASSLPKVSLNLYLIYICILFFCADNSIAVKTYVLEICSLVSRLLSFDRQFSPDEVLQLLDRFYNIEMLKPDDEEAEILNHEEDFSLPQNYFVKEE